MKSNLQQGTKLWIYETDEFHVEAAGNMLDMLNLVDTLAPNGTYWVISDMDDHHLFGNAMPSSWMDQFLPAPSEQQ